MAKGRFKIQWYADDVLKAVAAMTYTEEKASAERLAQRARRYVPVGRRISVTPFGGKAHQSRYPGRLKASIRPYRSRFPGGGFTVFAGDDQTIYYAHWVEFGTVFMARRRGYKYMRKAISMEKAYFTRRLRKQLGV